MQYKNHNQETENFNFYNDDYYYSLSGSECRSFKLLWSGYDIFLLLIPFKGNLSTISFSGFRIYLFL